MSLYARSDVTSVSVGPTGHTHDRPRSKTIFIEDDEGNEVGVYEKVWKLDCFGCEEILRDDPQWARNEQTIPLTPDEQLEADASEKTGNALVKEVANAMAQAATSAVQEMGAGVRG